MPENEEEKGMRYLLFSGSKFYPNGGWEDCAGHFSDLVDAKAAFTYEYGESDWAHIVDLEKKKMICTVENIGPYCSDPQVVWVDIE